MIRIIKNNRMPGVAARGHMLKGTRKFHPERASHGRAGQLAVLTQGPPMDTSVHPWDRAAGVEQCEGVGQAGSGAKGW